MKKMTIYVIHHSHTDVGYTDTQEKMKAHHVGFIREDNRAHQEAAAVQMELRKLLVRSAIFGGSYRGGEEGLREICEVGKYRPFGKLSQLDRPCERTSAQRDDGRMRGGVEGIRSCLSLCDERRISTATAGDLRTRCITRRQGASFLYPYASRVPSLIPQAGAFPLAHAQGKFPFGLEWGTLPFRKRTRNRAGVGI